MKVSRRSFFGFMGGAAASGPQVTRAIASDTLVQSGFPMGEAVTGAAPMAYESPSVGVVGKMVRWIRKTGIPHWKMQELKRAAEHQRSYGLDPDIAALRSVSGGWKAREQRRRNLERQIDWSLTTIGRRAELRNLNERTLTRFGHEIDWYE